MRRFVRSRMRGQEDHFVVEPDDGDTQEGDVVVGAENALGIDVDVEKLVQRLDVAHAAVISAARDDAVEAGTTESGAGGVEAKRAVAVLHGSEIDVCGAAARERNFHAWIFLAGHADGGIQAGVDDVAGGFQPAEPARVFEFVGLRVEELDDLAAYAAGDFERGNGEVKLIHATADELNQQPEEEATGERDFGPDVEVILRGVLVEMTNLAVNRRGIERRAAKNVEVRDEAGGDRNARQELFGLRNAFVDGGADAAFFSERGAEPRLIAVANALAGDKNPGVDAFFEEEGDDGVDGAEESRGTGQGARGLARCGCIGGEGHGTQAHCDTAAARQGATGREVCSGDNPGWRAVFVKLGLTGRRFALTMFAP